jgi:hypothetical protein
VPLGRNRAQPSRTVRVRPTDTQGTTRVRGTAQLDAARRQRGSATALLGEPTAARRRRTGDGGAHRRGDGGAARRVSGEAVGAARRRSGWHGFGPRLGQDGGATGEAVGAMAARHEAIGATAARARQSRGGRRERGGLSRRAALSRGDGTAHGV